MAILGAILAGLGSVGGASPPALHVIAGLFGTPFIDFFVRKRRPGRGGLAQCGVLIGVTVLSVILAQIRTRPSPATAFEDAFGVPPPAGVTNLSAKRRWFDGQITAIRFRADEQAIAAIVAARQFRAGEPDLTPLGTDEAERAYSRQLRWKNAWNIARVADSDPVWQNAPINADLQSYTATFDRQRTIVAWDRASREAYAEHTTNHPP